MTQPNQQLLACPDCGSVRAPVPGIFEGKVQLVGVGQQVKACPVCALVAAVSNLAGAMQEREDSGGVAVWNHVEA